MEVTAIIFKFAVGTVEYIMSSQVNILIKKADQKNGMVPSSRLFVLIYFQFLLR
jgi:hypothetical protein